MAPTTNIEKGTGKLLLQFSDREEIDAFFLKASEDQAFFLDLDQEPDQFQSFRCTAIGPGGFHFGFDAEVIQIFPSPNGAGATFELRKWSEGNLKEIERRLGTGSDEEEEENRHPSDVSPIHRLRKMNPNQRFRLAMKASRVERGILVRDTNPEVLAGLLSHPRIEEKEIHEILTSPYASGAIFKRVADNRKWMHNADIRLAVVKSPKTPMPLAIKHLATLRTSELRVLAKMGNAREALRKEALKIYLKRTGGMGRGM